jgi:predicted RNA-binding Zn-ribbon protein involved in translation (DUF1610 family)
MKIFQSRALLYDLIILLVGILLGYILFPVLDVSNLLLGILAEKVSSHRLLQLLVVSILVILVLIGIFLVHSYDFRKRYQHKKIYRYGLYWYKHKPYCPYCGEKLPMPSGLEWFDCSSCGKRIVPCDDLNKHFPKVRDILEIIKRET